MKELLITPLIQKLCDLINAYGTNPRFSSHFMLGFFADLFIVHQTGEQ